MDSRTVELDKKDDKLFLVTCIIYIVCLLLFICLRVMGGLGAFDKLSDAGADITFSILSQVVIMFLVPVVAIASYTRYIAQRRAMTYWRGKTPGVFDATPFRKGGITETHTVLKSWGFGKTTWRVIGFAFLLGALLYFFNIFVAGFMHGVLSIFGYRFPSGESTFTGISGFFVTLVLVGVLPGICEETAHRGLLLNGLRSRLGITKAILFSSIIFGLMHLNIVQCIYAAILGYLIALAVVATRSIWTGIIMHFMNNALNTFFGFAHSEGWFLGDFMDGLNNLFANFGFFFFLAFVFGMYCLIMLVINKFAKENYLTTPSSPNDAAQATKLTFWNTAKICLDDGKKPEKLQPSEKAVFYGIIFLGCLVTLFTLIWGFL